MEIRVIDSIEKLLPYKTEWESILKEMDNDIVFLEPDWIMSWWKFFGDTHRLFVLLVVDEQEVIGISPLMATNKGICKEIDFIGGRESCRMDFILRYKYRQEALESIFDFLRNLGGKSIIKFHGISEKSSNYTTLKEYLKANQVSFVSSYKTFYFINLEAGDFNLYFEHRFGKKTRQTMNSKEKRLEGLGNLVYKKLSLMEIDEAFEVHYKRWLRKIGNSSFSKGKTKEFYKELTLNQCARFKITEDAITLNNKVLSFIYGIEYNWKVLLIRIAHDDDFHFLSPGELVWKKKIEECFLSKVRVIDFGPGYEPYKAKWTDDYEKVFTIELPSNNFQSTFLFFIIYMTSIKLINALKRNKRIYNFRKYSLEKLKLSLSRENIRSKIKKVKRALNQNGLHLYLLKRFDDLACMIFSIKQYLIFGKYLKYAETTQNNLKVIEASIDDLDALSELMNESSSKVIRRFANRHKCVITLYNNKIIHYCWINCSNIEISNRDLNIPFGKTDVHIYDTFIEKKYENEYNYTYILSNIFNLLYKENYKRCYVTFDSYDKSFENEIYKKIFNPRYKVLERRVFGRIKHSIVSL